MPLPSFGGGTLRIDVRLAHALGRAFAAIGGEEGDPLIEVLAVRLRSLTDSSVVASPGEESGAGREEPGQNPVLELEDGV